MADIATLLETTGTKSVAEAGRIYREAFAGRAMPERAQRLVEALLTDPDRAAALRAAATGTD